MSIEQRLQSTFVSVFGINHDQLTEDATPETIDGWDSVNHIQLVLAIEAEFGVKFDPNEIPQLNSFQRICTAVSKLQA